MHKIVILCYLKSLNATRSIFIIDCKIDSSLQDDHIDHENDIDGVAQDHCNLTDVLELAVLC